MADSGDAVVVAPDVHRVEFENDRVRVLSFVTHPGQSWPLHEHPDCVAISVTEYDVRNVIPGQEPAQRHSRPGDVRWISATAHTGANVGAPEMRGVIVLEEGSKEFYARMSESIADERASSVFADLVADEAHHEAMLSSLHHKLTAASADAAFSAILKEPDPASPSRPAWASAAAVSCGREDPPGRPHRSASATCAWSWCSLPPLRRPRPPTSTPAGLDVPRGLDQRGWFGQKSECSSGLSP